MKKTGLFTVLITFVAVLGPRYRLYGQNPAPQVKPHDYCLDASNAVIAKLQQFNRGGPQPQLSTGETNADWLAQNDIVQNVNNLYCFSQVLILPDASQGNGPTETQKTILERLAPAQVSLWNSLESFSASQQTGSSLPSSGSTNPVSKPSGPTAIAEEFGGINVATGTSSLTASWSPGTMLGNLVLARPAYLCGTPDATTPCISPSELIGLTPLTFKITANTSNGSSSLAGTATTPSSAGVSQPVTVSTKGATGPSFSGLTVSYSFGGKSKSLAKYIAATQSGTGKQGASSTVISSAVQTYIGKVNDELKAAFKTIQGEAGCSVYKTWQTTAAKPLSADIATLNADKLAADTELQYQELFEAMLKTPDCQQAINSLSGLFSAVFVTRAAEEVAKAQPSATPEVGIEYDLNTPANKPAYSSFKMNGNWQFGRAASDNAITNFAANAGSISAAANSANGSSAAKQLAVAAKPAAQAATPPWSFTFNGAVDLYDPKPPSTIPSAGYLRDIQAGAELAYLFSPSSDSGLLREFIGSIRLSGAYSYQDQTSPAILTGPALTDFTGLPSSTTAAYAQRGIIHLGQVKLGLGTGSDLSYPLSFTYSNRTELVTHPVWGIQFGISYDLTSLFASANPSSK